MHFKHIKLIAIGLITGFINGLFGSGGGMIIVPALIFFVGIKEHKAHATAISIILPLSIISTFFYLKADIIKFNIALNVALGGIIGSFIGAKLLNKIPAPLLRKIFASIIILTAIRMILK
ncbi:MAG: sulfite exporter TauE/SafE family protein [Tissierellia bacterium]|nr:sulfite exporter TauE/SafE family protein [Tissierellia bacterium]